MLQWTNAATNEYYNEQFLSITSGRYNEQRWYDERCYNKRRYYNERCYNEQRWYNKRCYNEQSWYNKRCYNEQMIQRTMLQRTVFINKIRMLQRKRRNTIGRRNTRVRMTCLVFPPWLERQSSSLLSCVRFSYQFSCTVDKSWINLIHINSTHIFYFVLYVAGSYGCVGW